MTEWKPEKNISSPWDVDVWENNIGQPILKENTKNSNESSDTEILEFLLSNFQMHSPNMNGQHSWAFKNYEMKNLVGPTAKDAVIACMNKKKETKQELKELLTPEFLSTLHSSVEPRDFEDT